jgi:hypothetical protein
MSLGEEVLIAERYLYPIIVLQKFLDLSLEGENNA